MAKDAQQPHRPVARTGSGFKGGELRSPEDVALITGVSTGILLRDFTLDAAGGTRIPIGSPCSIEFLSDKVIISCFATREDVPYDTIQELQVSGSTDQTNAGVWGGGFGVVGAATGMLAATVINTLSARTKQYAVLRIATISSEYVFSSTSRDGSALSGPLTPVQVAIRKVQQAKLASPAAPQPSPVSLADELMKLARLRDDGVLSDEEFASAKAKLLGR